ncbi:DUF1553 domain-containing protein [Flexithrix dorotheae]|uniref:DUF1553 domain-containing protein n=1 Tax=Flexithrix dorotheae TaxID=70993 RepID=UPI0003A1CE51|nr:DUF1553 domain-containing protein [Flexithrix dorotheae]
MKRGKLPSIYLFSSQLLCLFIALISASCHVEKPAEIVEAYQDLPEKIDFNLHVKPILSDRCFACHGFDNNKREAGLRLDTEEGAYAALTESPGKHAIVPGKLGKSEVWYRMISDDPEQVMPPSESNLTLSTEEIATIAKWIEQGAEYKPHWSFIKPEKPEVPTVKEEGLVINEIDYFVLNNLEKQGLSFSEEANKETLVRRVYLDLTGLPPTLSQIDAFLNDHSENAYEKLVDRLLKSKEHAEKLTMDWLDVARYADSHGYHADGYRYMWPWRDWVIDAFDKNMPFDQFVTEQIAGDLMPNPSKEQILATAFQRNHPMTAEGGIVDEEYRLEYVFDRAITTSRAFLGLTLECSRCHDHKYDPLTQKDFYKLSAFYNNVNEVGMTGDDGNAGPMLWMTSEETDQQIEFIKNQLKGGDEKLAEIIEQISQSDLLVKQFKKPAKIPQNGLVAHYPLEQTENNKTRNLKSPSKPAKAYGELDIVERGTHKGLNFNDDYDYLHLEGVAHVERYEPFSIGVWAAPENVDDFTVIFGNAGNKNSYWRGYEAYLDKNLQLTVRLMHALPHNLIHISTKEKVSEKEWTQITITYDGSSKAKGLKIFLNGKEAEVTVHHDNLYKSLKSQNKNLQFGKSYRAFSGDNGIYTGNLSEIVIYNRDLSALEVAVLAGKDGIPENPDNWTDNDKKLAAEYFAKTQDAQVKKIQQELLDIRKKDFSLLDTISEVMVMEEMDKPRKTHVLDRGVYDSPKEEVDPGTPDAVLSFAEDLPKNRLGLAQWLFHEDNPLTARVTVNRYWQNYFGKGIVSTPEDFGNQGALPSHPKLLDWLAIHFRESGWDVKALQKMIVMSATYRQSSKASKELRESDPENILLARGPKHRMSAEMIRDNVLASSGLLVKKVGGPSVKPYQPKGLWSEKASFSAILLKYKEDKGEGLYRRSMYTFIRRTSPPPSMMAFDGSDRNVCIVRRQNTNTPLQALVLLNDPQYVEASRVLAEKLLKDDQGEIDTKIETGFRLLTGRNPNQDELLLFKNLYEDELKNYKENPGKARELLSIGDMPFDRQLDPVKTAALAVTTSMMMNQDEVYTKR